MFASSFTPLDTYSNHAYNEKKLDPLYIVLVAIIDPLIGKSCNFLKLFINFFDQCFHSIIYNYGFTIYYGITSLKFELQYYIIIDIKSINKSIVLYRCENFR